MNQKIFIFANDTEVSGIINEQLQNKLIKSGLRVYKEFTEETQLIICIGGDGTLLNLIQTLNFPSTPVVGINTGHLGFFQEVTPDQLDDFIFMYTQNQYTLQSFSTVEGVVRTESGNYTHTALNEIAIKGPATYPVHLNISINDSFIERFSGDGLCVATPAGSTAYNYSLGGSIVDPRLELLQVAPIAPMNSIAYRSFTSSILLPANDSLTIRPCTDHDDFLSIVYDGRQKDYEKVKEINLSLSEKKVTMIRFGNLSFWDKVKSKFL